MPREDRRVIFDMSETYQALYKLSSQKENAVKLIAGVITMVEESEDDPNKINFFLKNPQTGDKRVVIYTRDFLAAALMMYCRGAGIPLPRKAAKSVILEKDTIILRAVV